MSHLIICLLLIFISSFVLSAENTARIKCTILGAETKTYYFDTNTKRYQMNVNENGRPKTSLSRQVQQHVDRSSGSVNKVSYSFQIDDRTEINVDMDFESRHGTGEIKLKSKGHTRKFDKCKLVSSVNEKLI